MSVAELLGPDSGLTLVGSLAGSLWAMFKGSEWFAAVKRSKYQRALEVLEAAVEETYRTYVKAIKEGRADGKLTNEEQARARALARERALAIARGEGLDLMGTLGKDFIDLWVARFVKQLKAK